MRLPATAKWIGLALLGLVIAAAVAIAASNLVSQQIGIASESISAGDSLAPAIGTAGQGANRGKGGESGGDTTGGVGGEQTTTTPTQPPTTTVPTQPSEESGDDQGGGGHSGSDD